MSQALDTACGHPWSEHQADGCHELGDLQADGYPEACPCTRAQLDGLYEYRAEVDRLTRELAAERAVRAAADEIVRHCAAIEHRACDYECRHSDCAAARAIVAYRRAAAASLAPEEVSGG